MADFQVLGQFPLAPPFERSSRMYSRCCSLRLGRWPGKRPSVRTFACSVTERSLIELRHFSLKASTLESWRLSVAMVVLKFFDRAETQRRSGAGPWSPAARRTPL